MFRKIAFAALVALLVQGGAAMDVAEVAQRFSAFKTQYGKKYASVADEARRMKIFAANMAKAAALAQANPLARFGVNEFADLSADEFKVRHNAEAHYAAAQTAALPVEPVVGSAAGQAVDWRKKGAVTPVKNQGQCGSCWSFSTTGGIEGQWFLAGHALTSLSEQELVSCDTTDNGCGGGLMDNAFKWLLSSHKGTIVTEDSYPYVSGEGMVPQCNMANRKNGAQIDGFKMLPKSEEQMAAWMLTGGPLSIAVDASAWQSYQGGVMTNCGGVHLDHGVLAVGFDAAAQPPYWIIKNSWGPSWGEEGYIRVEKGTNQCLINNYPTTSKVGKGPLPPPAPPSPTALPTPAPAAPTGSLTQMVCQDAACQTGCMNHSFALGRCLPLASGGSAMASCTSTDIKLTVYPTSTDCTGMSIPQTQPVNQCVRDNGGSYMENFCSASSGALSAAALRAL